MENKFKDLVTSQYSEETGASYKVLEILNRYITASNSVFAFEAVTDGIPCTVRFYYNSSNSSIAELSITGGYNMGYRGEGPCTLLEHLEEFGFINSTNSEQFKKIIFTSRSYIFCKKGELNNAIFK